MTPFRAAAIGAAALLFCGIRRCSIRRLRSLVPRRTARSYVDAVVAHDAARLPLASDVKFTENGQRLRSAMACGIPSTGRGGYALKLADVERGQAVLMGTIREGGEPTVLVARLGIEERTVAEIETLVIRDRDVADGASTRSARRDATWSEPVARAA